ncbi:hypothetical protein STEG23_022999 [Scotinomys teguina]
MADFSSHSANLVSHDSVPAPITTLQFRFFFVENDQNSQSVKKCSRLGGQIGSVYRIE